MKLVIACARAGLIRGATAHPHVASYDLDHFSDAQLLEIVREPAIVAVVGSQLVATDTGQFTVSDAREENGERMCIDRRTGELFNPWRELGDGVSDTGRASTLSPGAAAALHLPPSLVQKPIPDVALPADKDVILPPSDPQADVGLVDPASVPATMPAGGPLPAAPAPGTPAAGTARGHKGGKHG